MFIVRLDYYTENLCHIQYTMQDDCYSLRLLRNAFHGRMSIMSLFKTVSTRAPISVVICKVYAHRMRTGVWDV